MLVTQLVTVNMFNMLGAAMDVG